MEGQIQMRMSSAPTTRVAILTISLFVALILMSSACAGGKDEPQEAIEAGNELQNGTGATSYIDGVGVPQKLFPAVHLDGVDLVYNTTPPPSSGPHWGGASGGPIGCGFYESGVRDEHQVS